jgi:hypothetical protein
LRRWIPPRIAAERAWSVLFGDARIEIVLMHGPLVIVDTGVDAAAPHL